MGTNNLSTAVDGEVIPASDSNQYKTALTGDLVPRNTSGVPAASAGDLGTATYPYGDVNLTGDIYHNSDKFIPTGSLIQTIFASATSGWLVANGDTIGNADSGASHTGAEFEALFELCKGYFGNAGTEVFNDDDTVLLPDLRGYFVRGWDNGAGIDSGRAINTTQADQNDSHSHQQQESTSSSEVHPYGASYYGGGGSTEYAINAAGATKVTGLYTSPPVATLSSGGTEARPKNIALNFLIKV